MQKTIDDGCFVDIGLRGPMWNGDEIMCEIMEKLATEAILSKLVSLPSRKLRNAQI
jgi:hypothetical protein